MAQYGADGDAGVGPVRKERRHINRHSLPYARNQQVVTTNRQQQDAESPGGGGLLYSTISTPYRVATATARFAVPWVRRLWGSSGDQTGGLEDEGQDKTESEITEIGTIHQETKDLVHEGNGVAFGLPAVQQPAVQQPSPQPVEAEVTAALEETPYAAVRALMQRGFARRRVGPYQGNTPRPSRTPNSTPRSQAGSLGNEDATRSRAPYGFTNNSLSARKAPQLFNTPLVERRLDLPPALHFSAATPPFPPQQWTPSRNAPTTSLKRAWPSDAAHSFSTPPPQLRHQRLAGAPVPHSVAAPGRYSWSSNPLAPTTTGAAATTLSRTNNNTNYNNNSMETSSTAQRILQTLDSLVASPVVSQSVVRLPSKAPTSYLKLTSPPPTASLPNPQQARPHLPQWASKASASANSTLALPSSSTQLGNAVSQRSESTLRISAPALSYGLPAPAKPSPTPPPNSSFSTSAFGGPAAAPLSSPPLGSSTSALPTPAYGNPSSSFNPPPASPAATAFASFLSSAAPEPPNILPAAVAPKVSNPSSSATGLFSGSFSLLSGTNPLNPTTTPAAAVPTPSPTMSAGAMSISAAIMKVTNMQALTSPGFVSPPAFANAGSDESDGSDPPMVFKFTEGQLSAKTTSAVKAIATAVGAALQPLGTPLPKFAFTDNTITTTTNTSNNKQTLPVAVATTTPPPLFAFSASNNNSAKPAAAFDGLFGAAPAPMTFGGHAAASTPTFGSSAASLASSSVPGLSFLSAPSISPFATKTSASRLEGRLEDPRPAKRAAPAAFGFGLGEKGFGENGYGENRFGANGMGANGLVANLSQQKEEETGSEGPPEEYKFSASSFNNFFADAPPPPFGSTPPGLTFSF